LPFFKEDILSNVMLSTLLACSWMQSQDRWLKIRHLLLIVLATCTDDVFSGLNVDCRQ